MFICVHTHTSSGFVATVLMDLVIGKKKLLQKVFGSLIILRMCIRPSGPYLRLPLSVQNKYLFSFSKQKKKMVFPSFLCFETVHFLRGRSLLFVLSCTVFVQKVVLLVLFI